MTGPVSFSRAVDAKLAQLRLTCPLGDRYMVAIDSGSMGHRRRCPGCGIEVVIPRAQFPRALRRLTAAQRRRLGE